jgi:CheY-like chemotaxis protein
VRDMADLLQRSIGPSIHIDTNFPLRLRRALADANQLELALLNLIVNARDAMPDGGTVIIAAREHEVKEADPHGLEPGTYVCLAVTDTGMGMDEQTLSRSVEPFFTTKGVGRGTGLGLSMIHGFAHQSGGRLVLRSKVGEGTTAEIWLPVVPAEQREEPQVQEDVRPPAPTKRLAVLVVDDDSLVLMNTAAMLEDLGHEVMEATSGEQALRILRRAGEVDVIITDQLMPGMTGTQLMAEVRKTRPDLPIILATGYADLDPGMDVRVTRLAKPFMQRDLARSLAATCPPIEGQVLAFRAK